MIRKVVPATFVIPASTWLGVFVSGMNAGGVFLASGVTLGWGATILLLALQPFIAGKA